MSMTGYRKGKQTPLSCQVMMGRELKFFQVMMMTPSLSLSIAFSLFAHQEQQSNQLERLQDKFMTPTVMNPVEQQASIPSKPKPDNSH